MLTFPTDGYSYEREAIEAWINTKNRSSPMTNLPLMTTLLTPNHTLKMAISRWKINHQHPIDPPSAFTAQTEGEETGGRKSC